MKTIQIKDLIVPLDEYATVCEDASLADAIQALERAQQDFDHTKYRHRAILVLDSKGQPIGKIGQLDALRALEPKYNEIQQKDTAGTFRHFSRMFLKSMITHYSLFDGSLDELRQKAAKINVKEFMHNLSTDECIDENAFLDDAIHTLIMGHHQSLLVSRGDIIVGILRLTDVFSAVFHTLASPPNRTGTGVGPR
jgi:CBS domain-containing protein